ncbi:MAG: protein kinase [Bryobacteraceae bacterium]
MLLSAGTKLGVYEVLSPLGAGGMGQVYKALDTKLDREVAIKILPAEVSQDAEHLSRFAREAKILASLNHPHIAQIYGEIDTDGGESEGEESFDLHGLVMELVPGETLANIMKRGPVPVELAVRYGRQIAEALEAAHEKGVVHRDLKPANVMVTPDGPQGRMVKVLDFGLAVMPVPAAVVPSDRSHAPTLTLSPTSAGFLLGTTAYMSPEQASGQLVDKRTDIWAFGVLLWEMLTGKHLFEGNTVAHVVADVLRGDINFKALPDETPASLRTLIRRCLDRDPHTRLRDIGEARVALLNHEMHLEPPEPRVSSLKNAAPAWIAAGLAFTVAVALGVVHFRETPPVQEPVRFQIAPPEKTSFTNTGVISPDGQRIVFVVRNSDGRTMLWVRALDSLEAHPVVGSEGATLGPFWSPDGQYIGFAVNGIPGRLKKVLAAGGTPQTLCEYVGAFREGSWNREGVIVFGVDASGMWRAPENGGTAVQVTAIDGARSEVQHSGPRFLPDGRRFLYHRLSRQAENQGTYIGSVTAGPGQQDLKRLTDIETDVVYAPAGGKEYLLYVKDGALESVPFDSDRGVITGTPVVVSDDVGLTGTYGWFSASANGTLVFRSERDAVAPNQLLWYDRTGKEVGRLGAQNEPSSNELQLSPDGKTIAVTRGDRFARNGTRVWTAELSRGIFSRLNSSGGTETATTIAPDGHVIFSSSLNGALGDIYWMPMGGVDAPELLLKSATQKHPSSVSFDGKYLIYDDHHPTQHEDLWILPLAAPATGDRKPIPFVATAAGESFGQFSPDSKWIAYSSVESGRTEVYVQGFAPDHSPAVGGGKWQISSAGGDKPRWRRDGKELYYLAPDRTLMAVPIRGGASLSPGVAAPLFQTRAAGYFPYDVGADGRFLINTLPEPNASVPTPITVFLNWAAGFTK